METIISRPAFGRASTNQKKKKKETQRKLGFVRLIWKDCVILESPSSLFKIANYYSLTRASASI